MTAVYRKGGGQSTAQEGLPATQAKPQLSVGTLEPELGHRSQTALR